MLDHEDDFVHMIGHMLKYRGAIINSIKPHKFDINSLDKDTLVVVGPGPGDPNSETCPKMMAIRKVIKELLRTKTRFLAVCLGHQFTTRELGFKVPRKAQPLQGTQKEIDLFGRKERVGFYCSFCPKYDESVRQKHKVLIKAVSVDPELNELNAVKGTHFISFMFHPESILTQNGHTIMAESAAYLCSRTEKDLKTP